MPEVNIVWGSSMFLETFKSTGKALCHTAFSFVCEDIVREFLEGQKTGHSTVETVFLRNSEVYMYDGKWTHEWKSSEYNSHDYCSWRHLVLNKHWICNGEWVWGQRHEERLKSDITHQDCLFVCVVRAVTLQSYYVNTITKAFLLVKADGNGCYSHRR